MPAILPNPNTNVEAPAHAIPGAPAVKTCPKRNFEENFCDYAAKGFAVLSGIFVGVVAAVVMGFLTGLIPFNC
jgi:hypothetical protein